MKAKETNPEFSYIPSGFHDVSVSNQLDLEISLASRAGSMSHDAVNVTAVFISTTKPQVTVTDRTMTVVSHGEIEPDQWKEILSSFGLLDSVIETVDYEIEDYPVENPAQTWRFTFEGDAA